MLSALTLQEVEAFHHERFIPAACELILVGKTTREEITPLLEKTLGKWVGTTTPAPVVSEAKLVPSVKQVGLVSWYGAPQSLVLLSNRGVLRSSKDYAAVLMLKQILGGSFSSRVNHELREESGITYGAHAGVVSSRLGSTMFVEASVEQGEEGATVHRLLDAVRSLREKPVTDEELAIAKATLRESIGLPYERDESAAQSLATLFILNLPLDADAALVREVEAMTAEDLKRVATAVLDPAQSRIMIIGDPRSAGPSLTFSGISQFDEFRMSNNK